MHFHQSWSGVWTTGVVHSALNRSTPGDRGRKTDWLQTYFQKKCLPRQTVASTASKDRFNIKAHIATLYHKTFAVRIRTNGALVQSSFNNQHGQNMGGSEESLTRLKKNETEHVPLPRKRLRNAVRRRPAKVTKDRRCLRIKAGGSFFHDKSNATPKLRVWSQREFTRHRTAVSYQRMNRKHCWFRQWRGEKSSQWSVEKSYQWRGE